MANLEDAVAYIIKSYPYKDELSNARVTKMLYLADWHSLINGEKPLTNINWYYDNYGPFVSDVRNAVLHSEAINSKSTSNFYGQPKELFVLSDKDFEPKLSRSEKASLDHVINQTKHLNWASFINLVYSTYPIASSSKYSILDLKKFADEYRKMT